MDRPVANWPCLPPPLSVENFTPNFRRHKQGRRSIYGPAADVMASIKSSNIHRFILAFWAFTWPPLQKFLIYLAPFLTFKKILVPFCVNFTRLLSEKVK